MHFNASHDFKIQNDIPVTKKPDGAKQNIKF